MQGSRLELVGEEAAAGERLGLSVTAEPQQPWGERVGAPMLLAGLKALSQRTLIAIAAFIDLALIASVFCLALLIVKEPSTSQLVLAAGYALFVVAAIYIRRRA